MESFDIEKLHIIDKIDYTYLSKCHNLKELSFKAKDDIDFEKLLISCPNLKSLSISYYNKPIIIPSFSELEELSISICKNDIFINTLPKCKKIIIFDCNNYENYDYDCDYNYNYDHNYNYNYDNNLETKKIKFDDTYPNLEEIIITDANIDKLPLNVPNIKNLKIVNTNSIITIPYTYYNTLTSLHIDMYKELFDESKYYNDILNKFINLENLNLTCIDINNIPCLIKLKELKLNLIPKITEFPIFPNLETLEVFKCRSLFKLDDMPKLRNIHILKCNNLSILNIHSSLNELFISKCRNIKHIPNISINNLMVYGCKYLPFFDENELTIQDYINKVSSIDSTIDDIISTNTYDINDEIDYYSDEEEMFGFKPEDIPYLEDDNLIEQFNNSSSYLEEFNELIEQYDNSSYLEEFNEFINNSDD